MSTPVSARNKPQGPPGSYRSARHCADAMPGPTSIPADYPVHHSGVTGRYSETRRAESIRPISKIHSFATRRRLRTATCDGDRASVRGSGVWPGPAKARSLLRSGPPACTGTSLVKRSLLGASLQLGVCSSSARGLAAGQPLPPLVSHLIDPITALGRYRGLTSRVGGGPASRSAVRSPLAA